MERFKFNNVTIFDSQDIRVTVNIVNRKKLQDGKEIDLVYAKDDGVSINPSVFLVFAFKNGDGSFTSAYLSFPHLRNLRLTMNEVMESLTDNLGRYTDSFAEKSYDTNPFGAEHKYLTIRTDNHNKLVILELMKDDKPLAGAALKLDMFAALESAIADLDLTTISVISSMALLDGTEPNRLPARNPRTNTSKGVAS